MKWILRLYMLQIIVGLVAGASIPWLKLYGVW
jgi:hypothetical protein